MEPDKSGFSERIYQIVTDIPEGYVATYGLLAFLAGKPGNSRQAGYVMSKAPRDLSSHRVVNYRGGTVPGWSSQRAFLEAEGVTFKANGCVDLKKHLWNPSL